MYYYGIQVGEHFSTVSLVEVGMQLAKIYWLIWVVFSIQGMISQMRPHFIKNTFIENSEKQILKWFPKFGTKLAQKISNIWISCGHTNLLSNG